MYALSYLINNSFCLLIMAIIFVCHLRSPDTRQSTGLFRAMVIGMMAFTVLDMLCGLQENGAIRPVGVWKYSFHTGLSILCMGCTVALVQVFINIQQSRITIDPLTQINNRSRLLQHLDKALCQAKAAGKQSRANLH